MAKFPDEPAFGLPLSAAAEGPDAPGVVSTQDNAPAAMHTLEIARADSQYLVQTQELRDALASEAEPDGLREKYEPLFQKAYDGSAAQISDPQQRDAWAQSRQPDFEGHLSVASDHAIGLTREREITGVATQLDAIRDLAVQTADPARRSEFIQAANGLITGLQAAGHIDETDAKNRQKAWAQDFAFAAFSKLPAAEQVKWLEGDAGERDTGKGELVDFVPADKRESLLQTAQLNLRNEERAAQSAAALERHNVIGQIRDDLAAILKEGKGIDDLASEKVQTILGPDALRDWQEMRQDFTAIRTQTEDLYVLTEPELAERLRSLASGDDDHSNPRKTAIYFAVQEAVDETRRLRLTDPARSVDSDPAVRSAQQQLTNSNDPQAQFNLYAARLAAQTRSGIDHAAQSPITKEEAVTLIAPLHVIMPGQEREALMRVRETFDTAFGADADRAFAFALRAQRTEAEDIFAATQAVKQMRLGGEGQPENTDSNSHFRETPSGAPQLSDLYRLAFLQTNEEETPERKAQIDIYRPIYDEIAAELAREDQTAAFNSASSAAASDSGDMVHVAGFSPIKIWQAISKILGKDPPVKPPARLPSRDPRRGDEVPPPAPWLPNLPRPRSGPQPPDAPSLGERSPAATDDESRNEPVIGRPGKDEETQRETVVTKPYREIAKGESRYTTINNREYVTLADGSVDFGELPKNIATLIGREPGPIRLPKGSESKTGELHMIRRGKADELSAAGYRDVGEFVDDVGRHFNEIWEGTRETLVLVKRGDGNGTPMMYVELYGAADNREWRVNSGGIYRREYTEGKKLLWRGERTPTTAAGEQVPSYTSTPK